MIGKGSLVRYKGANTAVAWVGKLLQVHEREGDKIAVYVPNRNGKWKTVTISIKDVEEVC